MSPSFKFPVTSSMIISLLSRLLQSLALRAMKHALFSPGQFTSVAVLYCWTRSSGSYEQRTAQIGKGQEDQAACVTSVGGVRIALQCTGNILTRKEVGLQEDCSLKGVDKHRTPTASVHNEACSTLLFIVPYCSWCSAWVAANRTLTFRKSSMWLHLQYRVLALIEGRYNTDINVTAMKAFSALRAYIASSFSNSYSPQAAQCSVVAS